MPSSIRNFAYLILNIFAFQPSFHLFDGSPRHKRSTHLRSQFHHDPPTDSQIVKQVESIIAYTLMYHYIVSNVLRKDRDLEINKSLSVLNGRRIKVLHQIIIISDRKSPKQERCDPVGRAKRTNPQKIFKNILAPLFFVVSLLHGNRKGIVNSSVYKFQFRIHCINIINTSERCEFAWVAFVSISLSPF